MQRAQRMALQPYSLPAIAQVLAIASRLTCLCMQHLLTIHRFSEVMLAGFASCTAAWIRQAPFRHVMPGQRKRCAHSQIYTWPCTREFPWLAGGVPLDIVRAAVAKAARALPAQLKALEAAMHQVSTWRQTFDFAQLSLSAGKFCVLCSDR